MINARQFSVRCKDYNKNKKFYRLLRKIPDIAMNISMNYRPNQPNYRSTELSNYMPHATLHQFQANN